MLIRPIEDADWPSFHPVFREVVSAGETYAYPEDLSSEEARGLWVESPPGVTVVAVGDDGTLLGSAKTGPNRPSRGSHVATASFMVASARPRAGRRAGARRRGCSTGRAEQGYAAMQFNAVVETNMAAVALWRELGFEVVGTVPEAFESRTHGRVGLHVMHRFL